jgi:hypothetical protein
LKSNRTLKTLQALALLICTIQVSGQTRISSPYSRFGIGDLMNNNSVVNMAMGGISYGLSSPYFVNPANPATYAAFDTLSFVFDVGAYGSQTKLITTNLSQTANFASLAYLKFGFPVTRWWRSSFGLLPYSNTGYQMLDARVEENIGSVTRNYQGNGGINQFYLGNSIAINKQLSIGFNLTYLFGTLEKSSATTFPDSAYRMNYKVINSTKVHDLSLNYGLFYKWQGKSGYHLGAGLVFSNGTNINATEDRLGYRYFLSSSGVDNVIDTVLNEPQVKGKIFLPAAVGGGFTFGKTEKWLVGADYQLQMWNKYSYFGVPDSLKNSMRISVGGQYTPSVSTVSGYLQRITYRAGVRYSNSFLELRGQQIDEFGISFGLGLPIPRTRSTVNLAAEIGTRGTTNENLIKENFVRFTLGLSIFERWFIIRKYD